MVIESPVNICLGACETEININEKNISQNSLFHTNQSVCDKQTKPILLK